MNDLSPPPLRRVPFFPPPECGSPSSSWVALRPALSRLMVADVPPRVRSCPGLAVRSPEERLAGVPLLPTFSPFCSVASDSRRLFPPPNFPEAGRQKSVGSTFFNHRKGNAARLPRSFFCAPPLFVRTRPFTSSLFFCSPE